MFSRLRLLAVFLQSSEILPEGGSLFAHGPTVTGVRRVATLHTQPTVQICQSKRLEFTCNYGSPPRTQDWVTTSSYSQNKLPHHGIFAWPSHTCGLDRNHRGCAGPHTDSMFPMPTHTLVQGCSPLVLLLEGSSSRVHP